MIERFSYLPSKVSTGVLAKQRASDLFSYERKPIL